MSRWPSADRAGLKVGPPCVRLLAVITALVIGVGCAAAPRQRPVKMGDVDTGAGSLEAVRRQLEGTWELVSLTVAPPGGGAPVPVAALGTLTYDSYGNLTIDAHTSDSYAPQAAQTAGLLSFKGRAVIDVAKKELKLTDLTGNVDPNAVLSPERRRRYAFEGDLLRLSSIDAAEQLTATSTWRRR
jgi:hypothetical protein